MNNFGDKLNEYIFPKLFNIDVEYATTWNADYIGIGSILDELLLQTKDFLKFYNTNFKNITKPIKVLSSGLGWETEHYESKLRFFHHPIFKRRIELVSVRGRYTLEQIKKINKNIDTSNVALGDLGLLASFLIDNDIKNKKYNLGICPHYAEKDNPIFQNILKNNPNSIIIDTQQNPMEFLKQLSSCRAIISTGMHPLIAADSLNIPNIWCRISEKTTTIHKYQDYYSIFSIETPKPYYLKEDDKINRDFIIDSYKIQKDEIEDIKNNLYVHHKNYFSMKHQ